MGLFDRLFGREETRNRDIPAPPPGQGYGGQAFGDAQGYGPQQGSGSAGPQRSEDEIAVERYRYLLRTAPPETIEQVHEEAFGKLTPEQRRMVFDQLTANAPAGERPRGDDPRSLAQAATRSELRRPGTLENAFGGTGGGMGGGRGYGGPGFGSMLGASLLGTVAGYVVGSALVGAMFGGFGDGGANEAGGDSGGGEGDAGADGGGDAGADAGGADVAGGDMGGGGDFGGDFGGF